MTELGPETLRPGDLMFGPIGGFVPGAFPVGAGQLLLADRRARLTWRRWRKIRHAGVVVPAPMGEVGLDLVQAMPHGAERVVLFRQVGAVRYQSKYWTPDHVYIRPAYRSGGTEVMHQDTAVALAAIKYVGTPYNFLTYGALAARKFGFVLTDHVLRSWISRRSDMMCSQLVDQCLADAGYHVFDDGRLPQDVAPAELFRALLSMPGQWITPGRDWVDNGSSVLPTA